LATNKDVILILSKSIGLETLGNKKPRGQDDALSETTTE